MKTFSQMVLPTLNLIDNPALKGREDKYEIMELNLASVLESWKISLFSFEWLLPNGMIRPMEKLPEAERAKYENVLKAYENNQPLERPILGIGIMENIEIGSRRDVLLTLMTLGVDSLAVHVPKANKQDFTPYL